MKLPLNRKFSPLKTSLTLLFNETILNLKKSMQHSSKRIEVINDKYYKSQVTKDIVQATSPLFRSSNVVENRRKEQNDLRWVEVRHNKRSRFTSYKSNMNRPRDIDIRQRPTVSYYTPTYNRYSTLGN